MRGYIVKRSPISWAVVLLAAMLCVAAFATIYPKPIAAQPAQREATWTWPKGLDPKARLVTAYRVPVPSRPACGNIGVTLIFQEPSGAIKLVTSDCEWISNDSFTVVTMAPPK